jgi:glutamate carboxypeptidase
MSLADNSNIPMRALLAGARRKQPSLIAFTRQLVSWSNPPPTIKPPSMPASPSPPRTRKPSAPASKSTARSGFGNALELRFGPRAKNHDTAKPILLLGHLDTVWPLGTLQSMPCRISVPAASGVPEPST